MTAHADLLADWSRWHDGYDLESSAAARAWVLAMQRLARPVAARGVPASVLSAAGVVAAAAAARTRARPAAAVLVTLAAVCDGLDGAVALHRGTASGTGRLLDHTCDRVTDVLFAAALRRSGASKRWSAGAAVAPVAFETLRDVVRRRPGGAPPIATVGERPVRVAAVVAGLAWSPSAGALVVTAMSAVAAGQLKRAAR